MPKSKQKDYPKLPIKGVVSIDSDGNKWKHGVGFLATHHPSTGEPRLVIGNTWFPANEDGSPGNDPAFMKSASSVNLETAEQALKLLQSEIKKLRTLEPIEVASETPAEEATSSQASFKEEEGEVKQPAGFSAEEDEAI